jgi:hypothetical protein
MNNTGTQANILELAKQGNAQAIATLINRQLQSKGITAKAVFKDNCLQIMLESTQIPNQGTLVTFIRKGITNLEIDSIQRVKVYGRQIGEEIPAWSEEIEVGLEFNPFSELSVHPGSKNPQTQSSSTVDSTPYSTANKHQPWYKKEISIFLLVLFIWPVGVYLMWKYSKTSTPVKWIITAFCSLAFFTMS